MRQFERLQMRGLTVGSTVRSTEEEREKEREIVRENKSKESVTDKRWLKR